MELIHTEPTYKYIDSSPIMKLWEEYFKSRDNMDSRERRLFQDTIDLLIHPIFVLGQDLKEKE